MRNYTEMWYMNTTSQSLPPRYNNSQCRIKFPRNDVVIENLFPVKMDRSLSVTNETDPLFHECADVEGISIPSTECKFVRYELRFASRYALCSDDTTTSHLLDGHNHLIDDLRDICFKHKGLLNFVKKGLRLMECSYMFTRSLNRLANTKSKSAFLPQSIATSSPPGTISWRRLTTSLC